MYEIGMGHNRGPQLRETNIRQLDPSGPSILEVSLKERAERRRLEVNLLLLEGQNRRKVTSGPLAVRIQDSHKRFHCNGRSRCHMGPADDLTTAAGDDDLSNHLYKAEEPETVYEYFFGDPPEDEEEYASRGALTGPTEKVVDDTQLVAPGACYSTASRRHQANLQGETI